MPPHHCLQSCQPPTAREVVNHPGSFTSFSEQWTPASLHLPCWSPRARSHWSTGPPEPAAAALPCLCQSLLPSQSCHFYFLSVAGHHLALCLPPASRVLAPRRYRKSRMLVLGPGEPHLDTGFQIPSITAAHHKQWPVLSPSQTNIDLAWIAPADMTTLPFIIFLGTGK